VAAAQAAAVSTEVAAPVETEDQNTSLRTIFDLLLM